MHMSHLWNDFVIGRDEVTMKNSSRFFENRECEYYPCHEGLAECNCMFCYCPLYSKEYCPGTPAYIEYNGKQIKDCSSCTYPHEAENYDVIMKML